MHDLYRCFNRCYNERNASYEVCYVVLIPFRDGSLCNSWDDKRLIINASKHFFITYYYSFLGTHVAKFLLYALTIFSPTHFYFYINKKSSLLITVVHALIPISFIKAYKFTLPLPLFFLKSTLHALYMLL